MTPQAKERVARWLYDNALVTLFGIVFGIWAYNVRDARVAYAEVQEQTAVALGKVLSNQEQILDQQNVMQRDIEIIRDRQDRNTNTIQDHEERLRRVENGSK